MLDSTHAMNVACGPGNKKSMNYKEFPNTYARCRHVHMLQRRRSAPGLGVLLVLRSAAWSSSGGWHRRSASDWNPNPMLAASSPPFGIATASLYWFGAGVRTVRARPCRSSSVASSRSHSAPMAISSVRARCAHASPGLRGFVTLPLRRVESTGLAAGGRRTAAEAEVSNLCAYRRRRESQ
jgi:hypothetical protein